MSVSVDQVVDAKLHIGNIKNESHPKTNSYRSDIVNGVVVISPESIVSQLEEAKKIIQEAKSKNKNILIVSDKQMLIDDLRTLAESFGIHYLNQKVPSWFLTNFDTFKKRISEMNRARSFVESEDFAILTKKEQLIYKRKLEKTERIYKWVKGLNNLPDLVIVVDGQMMSWFIAELEKLSIPSIVMASTNLSKILKKSQLIISNMLSYKSISFVLRYLLS